MSISWDSLLCTETLRDKEKRPKTWDSFVEDPFEQDYREIISSVSFRRLQDKAQIYQFQKGGFVRTRLTHSIEVSTVAKQLGTMLLYNQKWGSIPAFEELSTTQRRAIPTVLACAGLLHDMGNPPYGHEGEYAFGLWFWEHLRRDDFTFYGTPIRELLTPEMYADLTNFEGNAQAIRQLSKCRVPSDEQEANVSFATLSTLLKYPTSAAEMQKNTADHRVSKFGYYTSERELVHLVREKTGMLIPGEPHARNPLTYLLEAADDIAYIASDLEDAVSRKTISVHQLISFLRTHIDALPEAGDERHQMHRLTTEGILNNLVRRVEPCNGSEYEETVALHEWTSYLRNWLMYAAASSFAENWEPIMNGTFTGELLEESIHQYTVRIIKQEMRENVYTHLRDVHLAAHTILGNLLDSFVNGVIYWDTDRSGDPSLSSYEERIRCAVELIPKSFRDAYLRERGEDETMNLYLRFRMVADYLFGMTDGQATDLYQRLNAVSC